MLMAASNDLSVVVKALIMGNADVNQVGWDGISKVVGKWTWNKVGKFQLLMKWHDMRSREFWHDMFIGHVGVVLECQILINMMQRWFETYLFGIVWPLGRCPTKSWCCELFIQVKVCLNNLSFPCAPISHITCRWLFVSNNLLGCPWKWS